MRARIAAVHWLCWAVPLAVGWAWCVGALLPESIFPYDDDVGYLRSVVHTLQQGRPWTDDWLEPWAASLSVFAAFVYGVSGSFTAAIHGVLVVCAAAAAVALAELLRRRGLAAWAAVACAVVFLSFPAVLWKQIQFTSVALYLPMLLLALLAAETRRWWLFMLAFVVAVAARQSAVAWLVVPGVASARAFLRSASVSERREAIHAGLVVVCGVIAYLAIGAVMNETYAQRVMTHAMWHSVDATKLARGMWLGLAVASWAAGCSALLNRCFSEQPASGFRRWLAALVGLFAGMSLWFLPRLATVEWEIAMRETMARGPYAQGVAIAGVVGWWMGAVRIRLDAACAAVAAGVLVGLRGDIWDYYLLDTAVFGFLAVSIPQREAGVADRPRWGRWCGVVAGAGLVVAAFLQHQATALQVKRVIDGSRAITILAEHALRAGRIQPDALSITPFGYQT